MAKNFEEALIEALAIGTLQGIELFEEEVRDSIIVNSVLEENDLSMDDYIKSLFEEEVELTEVSKDGIDEEVERIVNELLRDE
jgi:hypothetical protein